jgi:hypothetical protein
VITEASADRHPGFSTHALTPAMLLGHYQRHFNEPPPPCSVLGIRGYRFEFGEDLNHEAEENLDLAVEMLVRVVSDTS